MQSGNKPKGSTCMKSKENCVMVCVTPQTSCARLIEAGKTIAARTNRKLIIVSVIGTEYQNNIEDLDYLYECVEKSNAEMKLFFNNDPSITVAVVAKRFSACEIITGFPGTDGGKFIPLLRDLLTDIPITMIDYDMTEYKMLPVVKSEIAAVKNALNLE